MIEMKMVLTRLYKQCRLGSLCHTSLRRPFSFLHFLPLINALFLPMNHIFSQLNPSPPFSRSCFVFVLALLWKQWVGGHLFPPVFPMPGTHTGTGRQHVWEPAGASWGWGGRAWRGPQTPAELSHPLSSPPPLPAPWWVVASRAHCPTQETNVGSLRGLSNLHLPPPPKKTSFPFTNLWTVMPC